MSIFKALSLITLLGAALALTNVPQVHAANRAYIEYVKGCYEPNNSNCSRKLIFVNNPELLIADDFADNGTTPYSLYTLTLRNGQNYRDFAEHINDFSLSGRRNIGYGFMFKNNGNTNVRVTIKRKSGGNPCAIGGGAFFADVFSNQTGAFDVRTIGPGAQAFVALTGTAPNFAVTGGCISSVADFDVSGGDLTMHHLVYSDARNIATNASAYVAMDYVTSPAQTARYYKGISDFTAVTARVSFTLNNSDVNKAMPMQYREYTGRFTDNLIWLSNINAGHRPEAMDSDLVTFNFQRTGAPTWNFGPRTLDGFNPPTIANLGNWGVVYRNEVSISNPTQFNRTVDLRIIPAISTTEKLHLAYFDPSRAQSWQSSMLTGRSSPGDLSHDFTYASCAIPAGTTRTCTGFFVIGGPSTADLGNTSGYAKKTACS